LQFYDFRGVFECDCGHDVVGYFLFGKAEDDVGFSGAGVSHEDDWFMRDLPL
jgi:hypothetical protein